MSVFRKLVTNQTERWLNQIKKGKELKSVDQYKRICEANNESEALEMINKICKVSEIDLNIRQIISEGLADESIEQLYESRDSLMIQVNNWYTEMQKKVMLDLVEEFNIALDLMTRLANNNMQH